MLSGGYCQINWGRCDQTIHAGFGFEHGVCKIRFVFLDERR